MTTNEYIRGVKAASWPSFNGRLWQRNYYEHVIREDCSLNRIRQYILDNPARWAFDRGKPGGDHTETGGGMVGLIESVFTDMSPLLSFQLMH